MKKDTSRALSQKTRRFAVTILLFVSTCAALCCSFHEAVAGEPGAKDVLCLLREKNFIQLEAVLDGFQKSYEEDFRKEENLDLVLLEFQRSDPSLEAYLNEWVTNRPGSYQAYLARGIFYHSRGSESRGGKWISETTIGQIQDMKFYFGKALTDLLQAARLNPKAIHAYIHMMGISRNVGSAKTNRALLDEALKYNPYSFTARWEYLWTLMPQWGGSIEKMAAFIDESRPYYAKNPALKVLDGRIDAVYGDQKYRAEEYDAAVAFYTTALTYGEQDYYLYSRGHAFYKLKKYDQAESDFSRLIARNPRNRHAFYMRARIYRKMKAYDNALADIDSYIAILNVDESILRLRGTVHYKRREYEAALKDYEQAVQLNPKNKDNGKKIKKIKKRMQEKGNTAQDSLDEQE